MDVNKIKLSICVCANETETDVHARFTIMLTPKQQGISSALNDIIKIIHIYNRYTGLNFPEHIVGKKNMHLRRMMMKMQ